MKHSNLSSETNNMPIIRIAPVCNGKIYVAPRTSENGKELRMDIPMEESVEHVSTKSDKAARKVKEKYRAHLSTSMTPRFSVRYKSPSHNGSTAYLYILPLKKEDEIHFHEGKFISAEEITHQPEAYSSNLQLESELLGMAAELWRDYTAASV